MSSIGKEIVENFARLLFCSAWADLEEEQGANFACTEIFDVAPDTPVFALAAAECFCNQIKVANSLDGTTEEAMEKLYERAVEANNKVNRRSEPPDRFGSDLAHMSIGNGVSWFDDNERFPLKVPYCTFDMYIGDDNKVYASGFEDFDGYIREAVKD